MRNICRLWVICATLLMNIAYATAQQNTIFRVKGDGRYGWNTSRKGNYWGTEAALELPLLGNHNWEYAWNFPTVGFALGFDHYDDLNPDFTFNTIQSYPYFHFPVVHTHMFALNLKGGWGMAGLTTTKDSLGTIIPVTGMLTAGINMDFTLARKYGNPLAQWMITLGANYTSYHNGHITRKARNFNTFDAFLGVKYTPNVWPLPIKYPAKPIRRILAIEAYGVGSVNQLDRTDNRRYYPVGDIAAGFYLPLSNCYRMGLVAESFYNEVYDGGQRTENIRYNFIKTNRFCNKLRAGVTFANELTMDRVNFGLHVGVYCYSRIKIPKYDEQGNENKNRLESIMYTKLVSRYYITPKFFVVFDLKTHLLKVECLQAGFGWAMPDFGDRVKNPFERISFKKEDKEELRID